LSQVAQHNAAVAKNQKAFKKANKPIQRKLKKQAEHKHRSDGARKVRPKPLKGQQRREPTAVTRRAADDGAADDSTGLLFRAPPRWRSFLIEFRKSGLKPEPRPGLASGVFLQQKQELSSVAALLLPNWPPRKWHRPKRPHCRRCF
jgi:hypothetical protein